MRIYSPSIEDQVEMILEDFQDFFHSDRTSQWTECDIAQIYVRKAYRPYKKRLIKFIDIASVAVSELFQSKGFFSLYLDTIIDLYPECNFFCEQVMNENALRVIERFPFERLDDSRYDFPHFALVRDERSVLIEWL